MAARCLCLCSSSAEKLGLGRRASSRSVPEQLHKSRTIVVSSGRHGKLRTWAMAADGDGDGDDGDAGSQRGRQLWRKELRSTDEFSKEFEAFDDEVRQSSTLERDIERLTKKEEVEKQLSRALDGGKEQAVDQKGGAIRDATDKVLVADFFFILFSLAWLVAGLAERAALESTSLIDSWLPLWPSVFQPALGVFMAGAIVSALTKKK